jgi:hypothetical protein
VIARPMKKQNKIEKKKCFLSLLKTCNDIINY